MSRTVPRGLEAGPRPEARTTSGGRGLRGCGRWIALCLGTVFAIGVVVMAGWRAGVFSATPSSGPGTLGVAPPATAPVAREDIAATTPVAATLGYAGSYAVRGRSGGTLTWLPSAGRVISQGQVLYRTGNGSPVVLLYGTVPDWRSLSEGVTGQDVSQLNHDLVALGDADSTDISMLGWDYFSWETQAGVAKLQYSRGVSFPSGLLPLGQVVFEPGAARVSQVTGSLGGPARGPVLKMTSDRHVVTVPLSVSDQSQIKTGDTVTVTLPDGTITPGMVSAVGRVATTSSGPGGSGSSITIPVYVTLTRPSSAGSLDQAPVTVNITTATARNVLAVPVTALLARSSGVYAVEVAGPGNTRQYVRVRPGIFDGADGLVQVTGTLKAGQRVVVAAP